MAADATALVTHLRAQPDDWASWLVFGDALLGDGDVRGDLIRLEHELATAHLDDAGRKALGERVKALIDAHRASWHATPPKDAKLLWLHGFVVGLELPWFLDSSAEALQAFLASPRSSFVTSLAITRFRATHTGAEDDEEQFDDEDADFDEDGEPIQRGPDPKELALAMEQIFAIDFSRLRTLSFAYLGLGARGAELLASAKNLSQLEQLDLRFNGLKDQGLKALAASEHLRNVRALFLQANDLKAEGAKALAAGPWTRLEQLDLRHNPIGAAGARALASAKFSKHLKRLVLQRGDVTAAGAKALAKSDQLPRVLSAPWKGRVHEVEGSDEEDAD